MGSVAIPMMIAAIFLLQGKGAFLISGYNMMSPAEKATYDTEALCRSTGKFLIVLTALMLLLPVTMYHETMTFFYIVIGLVVGVSIGYVIYGNTGNRFRIAPNPSEVFVRMPMSRAKKAAIAFGIMVSIVICAGIVVMFYQGERDPEVLVDSSRVHIKGMYGTEIPMENISSITLVQESMSEIGIGRRTNGFGGNALKGEFRSDELGPQLLFVFPTSSPTIRIERHRGNDIYISFKESGKTVELFKVLMGWRFDAYFID